MATIDDIRRFIGSRCHYRQTLDMLDYWTSRLTPDEWPAPPDFDPIDVPQLLPFLYLLERDGERLRYRVSGEAVNSLFGSQHTGRCLDEVVPPAIYRIVAPYFHAALDGRICLFKGNVVLPSRDFLSFERLLLPVTRRGSRLLLGCLSLSNTARLRADPPPPLPDGFHFFVYDMAGGTTETSEVAVTAEQFRRAGSCA